jgi:hypothetical protein
MVDHLSGGPATVLGPSVQVGVTEPVHGGLQDQQALGNSAGCAYDVAPGQRSTWKTPAFTCQRPPQEHSW